MSRARPCALYVLRGDAYEDIYGPAERRAIARLVDLAAPPQTAASIAADPSPLAHVELILSGWGAPVMDEAFLARAPCLRAVLYGAGSVRGFVTDALWDRGVRVTSAYALNAVPVAEYTLAVILFSLKHGWRYVAAARQGGLPPRLPGLGAYGSLVGLVGLGAVGRLVRRRLRPFALRVAAYDPLLDEAEARRLGVRPASLDELFRAADVVSLHAPLLPGTRGMVTRAHIESMRPGATLVNTARGGLVDEPGLVEALRRRPDLQAVLDVTDPEPPPPGSPLYALDNVVLTPHIAGSLGRERRRLGRAMVAELRRYVRDEPLAWELTRERAAEMA